MLVAALYRGAESLELQGSQLGNGEEIRSAGREEEALGIIPMMLVHISDFWES